MKPKASGEVIAALLNKPCLSRADIQDIEGCGRDRAYQIIRLVKAGYDGEVPMRIGMVKTSSYLQFCGYPDDYWADMIRGARKNAAEDNILK